MRTIRVDTSTDTTPAAAEPPVWACRVNATEARFAFERGEEIVVSEFGTAELLQVGPHTVTHSLASTTWKDLAAQVKMWRNRYPHQRFYIVIR